MAPPTTMHWEVQTVGSARSEKLPLRCTRMLLPWIVFPSQAMTLTGRFLDASSRVGALDDIDPRVGREVAVRAHRHVDELLVVIRAGSDVQGRCAGRAGSSCPRDHEESRHGTPDHAGAERIRRHSWPALSLDLMVLSLVLMVLWLVLMVLWLVLMALSLDLMAFPVEATPPDCANSHEQCAHPDQPGQERGRTSGGQRR